jgi:hypothetical protein
MDSEGFAPAAPLAYGSFVKRAVSTRPPVRDTPRKTHRLIAGSRLGQLVSLPSQQLPVSILLLPDLESADLDSGGLAVGFAFSLE